MTDVSPTDAAVDPLAGLPCRDCGAARLRLERRLELVALPLGTWSLAGRELKTSAVSVWWPWCVCGGCGAECRGKAQ